MFQRSERVRSFDDAEVLLKETSRPGEEPNRDNQKITHMMTIKQFETVQKAHGYISEQQGQSPGAFQRERVWC